MLAQVEEVTTDMWDGYVEAVHAACGPAVRVVIDRFHVMKQLQEQLTAARREIQRQLPAEDRKALKGSRWLWQKNAENLTQEQRAQLADLKQRYPLLGQLAD